MLEMSLPVHSCSCDRLRMSESDSCSRRLARRDQSALPRSYLQNADLRSLYMRCLFLHALVLSRISCLIDTAGRRKLTGGCRHIN